MWERECASCDRRRSKDRVKGQVTFNPALCEIITRTRADVIDELMAQRSREQLGEALRRGNALDGDSGNAGASQAIPNTSMKEPKTRIARTLGPHMPRTSSEGP